MRWLTLTTRPMSLALRLLRSLEGAALPNVCVFCGARCRLKAAPICTPCYADLPWIDRACPRCAKPVVAELSEDISCAACQQDPPPFTAAVAALGYSFPIDAAIKAMKFRRKLCYVPAFVHTLMMAAEKLPAGIDALLPVPLHWRRQALRGFNQAAELCRPLCRQTGLEQINNVVRRRPTPYQSGLAARLRRGNLRSAFSVQGPVAARHVLIVDDVITTGETCRELAQVLRDAGVEKVSVLAVARA